MTSAESSCEIPATLTLDKNNPREVFGWKMYDWANSAFSTTIVGALFGPYLTEITQRAVGENGTVLNLGPLGAITAKSFFPTVRFDRGFSADIPVANTRRAWPTTQI